MLKKNKSKSGNTKIMFNKIISLVHFEVLTIYKKTHMFQNSAFYIEFKGAKNPHVLEVLVGVVEDSGGS